MAVSFSDVQTVCQEAFYLLRQDASEITSANWSSATPPIEIAKLKLALDSAIGEVLESFTWGKISKDATPAALTDANVSKWPRKVRGALVSCLARELALPIAGRMEDMKAMDALYRERLLSAKIEVTNALIAANTDPILAEILAVAPRTDSAYITAYDIYAKRIAVVKATATVEINAAHDWQTAFSDSCTTHIAYSAWVVLCCAKLAAACGLDANHVSMYEQKYQSRLRMARAADLEESKTKIYDTDMKEVFAKIATNFTAEDATLPRSITQLIARVEAIKSTVRQEVILAHGWNFARVKYRVGCAEEPCSGDYRFVADYPYEALRLLGVFGRDGERVEWKVENGTIRSTSFIETITFIKDVEDKAKWSSFFRIAYLAKLAAAVARTVMNNPQDAQIQEAAYLRALEDAKLRDTRESSTPTDAWGENFYVKSMRGSRVASRFNERW